MVSLLTNESAMVALGTLRMVNKNLTQTQAEISTGKSIGSARDNAAIWAVSTVMESDVESFKAISESLDLGASTVAVARSASEQVTDLLVEIKGLVVAAQEDNVDRSKIQTDIGQLRGQIGSIVNAAQFNGLNLLKGTDSINVLSSLDRAADQSVSDSKISVGRSDLSTSSGTFTSAGVDLSAGAITGTVDATVNATPRTSDIAINLGDDGTAEGSAVFGFSINSPDLESPIEILTAPSTEGATQEQIADALVTAFDTAKTANPSALGNVTVEKVNTSGTFSVRVTNRDAFDDLTLASLGGSTPLGDGTAANDDGALTVAAEVTIAGEPTRDLSIALGDDDAGEAGSIYGFNLDVDGSGAGAGLNVSVTLAGAEDQEAIVDAIIAQAATVSTANANAFADFTFTKVGTGTTAELRITRTANVGTAFGVTAISTPAAETDTANNRDAQVTVGTATVASRASVINLTNRTVNEGDAYRVSYQGTNIDYVARAGDTVDDIGDGLRAALEIAKDTNTDLAGVSIEVDKSGANTLVKIDDGGVGNALSVQVRDGGTAAGGLVKLGAFDVSTKEGAQEALSDIEGLIQTGINAAASFGSAQKRIEIQGEFVTSLVDSLRTGIGALTDADMEEASARLQSLQVQQQLGIQALSIANQQPQALLSLFR